MVVCCYSVNLNLQTNYYAKNILSRIIAAVYNICKGPNRPGFLMDQGELYQDGTVHPHAGWR